jgi:hypothetical protein
MTNSNINNRSNTGNRTPIKFTYTNPNNINTNTNINSNVNYYNPINNNNNNITPINTIPITSPSQHILTN